MYFFPNLEPVCVPCPVLTVASWPGYRILRRQVRWFGIPISWRIVKVCCDPHKGFGVVRKAEVDVFLELSCFFDDPVDVGNLISGSTGSWWRVMTKLGPLEKRMASPMNSMKRQKDRTLKGDAVKVLHSICQQVWKTQQWPQDWKSQFSFQSQRKAMPKNAQTTAQLYSSHTLVK